MLSTLRHKGVAKKVLWFVTIIIVLSFAFMGVVNNFDNSINSAGTLYGKNVSIRDFQKAYFDARDQAIMLYGDRFFKMGDRLDLEKETWDRLILVKETKKRGITVSNQELAAAIAAIPFFQRDGKFDKQIYDMIVKNPSIFNRNPHDFEEGMRGQLAIRKLVETIVGNADISPEELKKEFQLRHEKIKLSYVLLTPQAYLKDVSATDEEVKGFYESRKDQFRQPATISLDYITLPVAEKASDADKAKAKQEAFAVFTDTKSMDFGAAAKKHHLELKTSPFFSVDQPLLTFVSTPQEVEQLFALKVGEYAKPREMPDGWQIVRIKDKKESHIPSFDEAKAIAQESLLTQKAFELAKTKADEAIIALKDAIKTKDFKSAANSLKLPVQETPAFSRGEYIANMGLVAEFQEEANRLTKDNPLSTVVATSQGAAILHLDSSEMPSDDQFNAEAESFKQQLSAERRNQQMVSFMTTLQAKAKVTSKIKRQ